LIPRNFLGQFILRVLNHEIGIVKKEELNDFQLLFLAGQMKGGTYSGTEQVNVSFVVEQKQLDDLDELVLHCQMQCTHLRVSS
jgi:hypothetical protein